MTGDFAKLLDVLDAELLKYRRLLELARRKADLLSSRAPAAQLERVVAEETSLVMEVTAHEENRIALMKALASGLGMVSTVTLTELLQKVSGETAESLQKIGKSIVDVLTELRKVNSLNEALLNQELALVNFTVDAITNRGQTGRGTYSDIVRGAKPRSGPSALLDARA